MIFTLGREPIISPMFASVMPRLRARTRGISKGCTVTQLGHGRGQLDSAETYASAQNFQTVQDTRAGSFISGASRRLDIGGRPKALHARITNVTAEL